jgi:hypothetical protein
MPHTDPGTFWNRLFRDVVEAENEHDRLHDQMDRTLQPMDFNGIPPADACTRAEKLRTTCGRRSPGMSARKNDSAPSWMTDWFRMIFARRDVPHNFAVHIWRYRC